MVDHSSTIIVYETIQLVQHALQLSAYVDDNFQILKVRVLCLNQFPQGLLLE